MNPTTSTTVLTFSILCFISAVSADDVKTLNGKEYKDATVTRVEPDGIVLKTKSGVIKVYFTELSKDVQERFHYEPGQATSYSTEQAANYAAYQKQEEETRRQQADAGAKNRVILAKQRAATNRFSRLVRRSNPDQRTMVARITALYFTIPIRKNLNYRFSRATSAMFVAKKASFESNWKKCSIRS
jgi:hypothetical protein